MTATIDLNADLGEGFGQWRMSDDAGLLDIVTSANVACGFHAGDPTHIRAVCDLAAARGTSIGAHVAYRDLAGFGRRFIDIDPAELRNDVIYQLAALDGMARAAGTTVRYIKPHGALYNAIVHHEDQARAVVDAIVAHGADLPCLGLPGAVWLKMAKAEGLRPVHEAFADRNYTPEGRLAPRTEPRAKLTNPEQIAERTVRMATQRTVVALDGSVLEIDASSVCVHGDNPTAVAIAEAVRDALTNAGVVITAFA